MPHVSKDAPDCEFFQVKDCILFSVRTLPLWLPVWVVKSQPVWEIPALSLSSFVAFDKWYNLCVPQITICMIYVLDFTVF